MEFRVDYKHMHMHTQLFHLWKKTISKEVVAHKPMVRVKSPVGCS